MTVCALSTAELRHDPVACTTRGMINIHPTAGAIVGDPAWLVHRYDSERDEFQFVDVDRSARRAATFLTDEYLAAGLAMMAFGRENIVAAAPAPAPLHFILHSAFCCSTLLANAFDRKGIATSLKEPVLFNDIVGFMRRGGDRRLVATLLDQTMTLLARPFEPGEAVVVKPSNIINGFATAIMAVRPASHALLLHAPLDVFLGSVAKKGMWGRLWARTLFLGLAKDGLLGFGYTQEDYLGQTDLQIAALCWLAQQALFARMVERFGDRVRTLDSSAVTTRPADVVEAIAKLFRLPIDARTAAEIADGPAFTRHSKFGTPFGGDARLAEVADARATHADELDKVMIWARAVAEGHGIAVTLANPLLG